VPDDRVGRQGCRLARLPIQTCWPEDAGPHHLGADDNARARKPRQNLGIYRQQVIASNKLV